MTGRAAAWIRALVIAGVVLLALPVSGFGFVLWNWHGARIDTTGSATFDAPLRIPALATSRVDGRGRRVFDLDLRHGTTDFGRGGAVETWGINGSYLGPTLRARRGEQVLVHVTNRVGEATTLHWHGMHLPARMDGGPHQVIADGSTWSPTWRIDQPAASLWYHPHLHGRTAEHVHRGLAGMFLVDDDRSAALDLPDRYGLDDLPVIVQDRSFTTDGRLDDGSRLFSPTGRLGDTVLVNGTITPHHEVRTERVRLRLLNASDARVYTFGLAGGGSVALVGTDGGLLTAPVAVERVRLSPGERAEVVVSLRPGQDAVLRSYPTDLGADVWNQRFAGGDDTLDVLQLRAAAQLEPAPALPARLAEPADLRETDAVRTRTFRLSGTKINSRRMDPGRIDEVVPLGDTEVWEVHNSDGAPHNFHVHDVQFRVLDVDGGDPGPELSGWKDTAYVAPGTRVRLLLRFSDHADPGSPYMFHCHLLRHEDQGMMGQFVVVRPGQQAVPQPARPADPDGHRHS